MRRPHLSVSVMLGLLSVSLPASARTLFVKADAPGPVQDGTSWATAHQTVAAGLGVAAAGDELWVAAGTYRERITLKDRVSLYGGFAGTETVREQRFPAAHETIIDAGIGSVVTAPAGVTIATVLDGFTIRNGAGVTGDYGVHGGGIFCQDASPTITGNVIRDNPGGGLAAFGGAPVILRNRFLGNGTGEGIYFTGGGLFFAKANGIVANNVFDGNTAGEGPGIHLRSSSPRIVNNAFVHHHSGGGVLDGDHQSRPAFANNIIAFNDVGMSLAYSPIILTSRRNCFFGNVTDDRYTQFIGVNGNFVADPQFVSAYPGDYRVKSTSGCIDEGDSADALGIGPDLYGQTRTMGVSVDVGAFESPISPGPRTYRVVRVSPLGVDTYDGSSWARAKRTIQAAVSNIPPDPGGEVWVAAGTYPENVRQYSWVSLFGGFAGVETAREERDWWVRASIIDARGLSAAVSVAAGASQAIALDGFTLRNGKRGTYGHEPQASGVWCDGASPTICNNTIVDSADYAIGLRNSSAVVSNNVILRNAFAAQIQHGAPRFTGNRIADNGGGILCHEADTNLTAINNTFVGNMSGGAITLSYNATATLLNNLIAFNGTGVYNSNGGAVVLRNNCVYGNTTDYAGVPDSTGTNGNIRADPVLADYARGDLHIQPPSPCRDAGDDASAASAVDLDGQPRIHGAHVDIGADESDGIVVPTVPLKVIRVRPDGNDANDGSTWALARRTIQAAVDGATLVGAEVWVAGGTYAEALVLKPHAYVYGGFSGSEDSRSQRDIAGHPTVIDAKEKGPTVTARFGYFVTGLDGLTLMNPGESPDTYHYGQTAIYCNAAATFANDTVYGPVSSGSGSLVLRDSLIHGTITANNAVLRNNVITGVYNYATAATVSLGGTSDVVGNVIHNTSGVGLSLGAGSVMVRNSTLAANGGFGIVVTAGQHTLVNNIVAANGGGVQVRSGAPAGTSVAMRHNCVFGNVGAPFDGLPDPTGSNGNIRMNPLLAFPGGANLHIQPASPCRDAGEDAAVEAGETDLDGQQRILGSRVDIGADESDGTKWEAAPPIIRVRPGGNDAADGLTWATAKRTLVSALDAASGGEVWVAAGTYAGGVTVRNIGLYGGFAGIETDRNQRDPTANETVLDGGDATSVVRTAPDATSTTIIDGFTIRNGHADHGGGVWIPGGTPVISHNRIMDSNAVRGGGVMVETSADPLILANVITGNTASGGGGIEFWTNARGTVKSNLIHGNTANYGNGVFDSGGCGYARGKGPVIANNTVLDNVDVWTTGSTIVNNIVAARSTGGTWRNNVLIAGTPPPGNTFADPRFVDPANGDYRLLPGSPCIDAGDDSVVALMEKDLDGNARVLGPHVDVGAYEFVTSGSFTIADAGAALRIGAGLQPFTAGDARLDVEVDGRVNAADALRLARKAAGLEPNP